MSIFRFPEGVEFGGHDDGQVVLRVSIPLDDDGFFGRQCPKCQQLFRVAHDDYEALPEDVGLWCVHCGHHDDHSEFLTEQQKEGYSELPVTTAYNSPVRCSTGPSGGSVAARAPR